MCGQVHRAVAVAAAAATRKEGACDLRGACQCRAPSDRWPRCRPKAHAGEAEEDFSADDNLKKLYKVTRCPAGG